MKTDKHTLSFVLGQWISLLRGTLQAPSADEKHEIGTTLHVWIMNMLGDFLVTYRIIGPSLWG